VNNVEISAQEAVCIVLQLPMRKASRQVVFINTSPPEERVQLLKPLDDINDMEDDCEDIYTNGLIKRYTMRPSSLENVPLQTGQHGKICVGNLAKNSQMS